jgi:ribokinase
MTEHKTWDIVVVGGANMDYLVRGQKLPKPGETVMGDEFQEAPGGKGVNQAVVAARLGARVAFIARVGEDQRGEVILKRLKDEGVNTEYILRDQEGQTGVALILVGEGGEKEILTAPGANRRVDVGQVRDAKTVIQSARMLLTQLEVPLESVMLAAQLAHQATAKIVLDPAPPVSLPEEFLCMVNVIKPNASEAEALTGIQVKDRNSARKAAKQLIERGVEAVAVQAGDEGNLLVTSEQEYWLPKLKVQSVDATGAGDAFPRRCQSR